MNKPTPPPIRFVKEPITLVLFLPIIITLALLAVLLFVNGCAYRFQTNPKIYQGCLLYCRISDCTAKDIPTPLAPSASDSVDGIPPLLKAPKPPTGGTVEEGKMAVQGDDTHCTTLEVGAKSYSDTLMALGLALGAIYAKIHGVF